MAIVLLTFIKISVENITNDNIFNHVTEVDVEGIDGKDYPDFCDAYISMAILRDGDILREATDAEIDTLNDDREYVYNCVIDKIY